MGRKLKDRTFILPNYVRNYDQILYNILFIAKSIYNISGSIPLLPIIMVGDSSPDQGRDESHNQDK